MTTQSFPVRSLSSAQYDVVQWICWKCQSVSKRTRSQCTIQLPTRPPPLHRHCMITQRNSQLVQQGIQFTHSWHHGEHREHALLHPDGKSAVNRSNCYRGRLLFGESLSGVIYSDQTFCCHTYFHLHCLCTFLQDNKFRRVIESCSVCLYSNREG